MTMVESAPAPVTITEEMVEDWRREYRQAQIESATAKARAMALERKINAAVFLMKSADAALSEGDGK
jgi:phage shock protein A